MIVIARLACFREPDVDVGTTGSDTVVGSHKFLTFRIQVPLEKIKVLKYVAINGVINL